MGTIARILLAVALLLPLALHVLIIYDMFGLGMTWLLSHQVYYAPFAWLGEPFYTPNKDIGFFVQPLGRMVVAVAYAAAFIATHRIFKHLRKAP